ncbi:aldehyde dehydrogenase family protein [Desulfosediminicola ganghwensis]|uniref:aldehyde dehydrogenase family protein n=1 Tax=Desulfosediminicola ganghwensis TaxID=2569540 RepID=UPI0010AC0E82|nr:aldehyde dehydrogenase family protein [Desulfosediminicola ganghwensis]
MSQQLQSFDPGNGELLGAVEVATENQIEQVVIQARTASAQWSDLGTAQRTGLVEKAWAAAEPELHRLAELLGREMGKDIRRATGEVSGTIYGGPYIAQAVANALQPSSIGRTTIEYKPFGIVAVISPWNYPLAMANNLLIPALVAGNTVIWKPSEETPLIAQAFFDLVAGKLPEHVLQIVHGDGEQGKMLVESDVNMIAFTGSRAAGKDIMQRAATSLKRLVMELGGNDPMLVMADADLAAAARFAVASSFENAGQMCTSTERIYVDETVAAEFNELVVGYARQYRVGPWNMDNVNIGPIVNHRQHRTVLAHIKDAVEKGAKLLLGSDDQQPPYIQPTVIAGMTPDMRVEQEETFGPLICISTYSDIENAITRANHSDYGLGAVVFGGSGANTIAGRLEAGMIGINQGVGGEGDSPWVGAKQSGLGFHGSTEGHRQFAQVRVVNR